MFQTDNPIDIVELSFHHKSFLPALKVREQVPMTAGIIRLARHRSTVIKNKKYVNQQLKNRRQRKFDVHIDIVAKREKLKE